MKKFKKSEVLSNGTIQLQEVEVLELKNGSFVDGDIHREVFTPDMDITSIHCDKCRAMATAIWTPEVIKAYTLLRDIRSL